MWNRIKNLLGSDKTKGPAADGEMASAPPAGISTPQAPPPGPAAAQLPAIPTIAAADNPWNVPLLDVRPVTLTMVSTSKDAHNAANAVSFRNSDGTEFIGQEPKLALRAAARLTFRIDRMLAEGVLFVPGQMEHKWAIFYHRRKIIFVRSWLREVAIVADVEEQGSSVEITAIHGGFGNGPQDNQLNERIVDFILRSHVLAAPYPAPLPAEMGPPGQAALWCFSMFGNRASLATMHTIPRQTPEKPLRSHSLLHIAVARGDEAAVRASLAAGVPVDLLAGDGMAPLHWSLVSKNSAVMDLLLECGSPIDVRSAEGATPLMNAVQGKSTEKVSALLDRGADANAGDNRGFTALHRAAEMGLLEIAGMLLSRGAAPDCQAEGHTPLSLAEKRGNPEIVALLKR
jgi:hypothetical protein